MLVFKLEVNAGVPQELSASTDKKTTALTNAQMVKSVEVNTLTQFTNLLSPWMSFAQEKSFLK
jgi:hypothetical protein